MDKALAWLNANRMLVGSYVGTFIFGMIVGAYM